MGEIADAILEGDLCQFCGCHMDGQGFPQACDGCERDNWAEVEKEYSDD